MPDVLHCAPASVVCCPCAPNLKARNGHGSATTSSPAITASAPPRWRIRRTFLAEAGFRAMAARRDEVGGPNSGSHGHHARMVGRKHPWSIGRRVLAITDRYRHEAVDWHPRSGTSRLICFPGFWSGALTEVLSSCHRRLLLPKFFQPMADQEAGPIGRICAGGCSKSPED